MNTEPIRSLKTLKQRKVRLAREMARCESRLSDGCHALTRHSTRAFRTVRTAPADDNLPLNNLYRLTLNIKRLVDMFRLGMAIYRDYRK